MERPEITSEMHAELLALQNLAVGDIRFYKEQQWKISNYCLLLYAAIVGITKILISNLTTIEAAVLLLLALAIMISGVVLIHQMGVPLAKGRDRLSELRQHFDREVVLKAYSAGESPDIALQRSKDKVSLEKFFYCIIVVGFVITVWVLLRIAHA